MGRGRTNHAIRAKRASVHGGAGRRRGGEHAGGRRRHRAEATAAAGADALPARARACGRGRPGGGGLEAGSARNAPRKNPGATAATAPIGADGWTATPCARGMRAARRVTRVPRNHRLHRRRAAGGDGRVRSSCPVSGRSLRHAGPAVPCRGEPPRDRAPGATGCRDAVVHRAIRPDASDPDHLAPAAPGGGTSGPESGLVFRQRCYAVLGQAPQNPATAPLRPRAGQQAGGDRHVIRAGPGPRVRAIASIGSPAPRGRRSAGGGGRRHPPTGPVPPRPRRSGAW